MTDQLSVIEAYAVVQANKDRYTWDEWPPSMVPTVTKMIERVKRDTGSGDPHVIEAALNGAAWMVQMFHQHDLDFDQGMDMAQWVEGTMKRQMDRMRGLKLDRDDLVRLGIGGGLYTGLWVGLLIGESRNE